MSQRTRKLLCAAVARLIVAFIGGAVALMPDGVFAKPPSENTPAQPTPARPLELNTILMKSTYMVLGPATKEPRSQVISFGTAFLMGKPIPGDPVHEFYVLITAGHVLDEIESDTAMLRLRQPQPDGSYVERPWSIAIRERGKDLYVKPPNVDVAALYVNMPDDLNVTILPTALLADDKQLENFEIHPGDQLFCLGFPLGVSTPGGFPVLRSGKIASYPVTPTSIYRVLHFDFNVFKGNSGGPVYFVDHDRLYGGTAHIGEIDQFVVGLVIQSFQSTAYQNEDIRLAGVVPASFILEALNLLPAKSPFK